jgi:hypothetical protein
MSPRASVSGVDTTSTATSTVPSATWMRAMGSLSRAQAGDQEKRGQGAHDALLHCRFPLD